MPHEQERGHAQPVRTNVQRHGRRVADIDLLVSELDLSAAEAMLKCRGWDFSILDPYDERFYREWMHELPPMIHRERHSARAADLSSITWELRLAPLEGILTAAADSARSNPRERSRSG